MSVCKKFSKCQLFLECVVPSWYKAVPGVCHSKFSTKSLDFIKHCPFFHFFSIFFSFSLFVILLGFASIFLVYRQLYLKARNYYILRCHLIQSNKSEGNAWLLASSLITTPLRRKGEGTLMSKAVANLKFHCNTVQAVSINLLKCRSAVNRLIT